MLNLFDFFRKGLRAGPNSQCLSEGALSITYADVDALTANLCHLFKDLGITTGEKMAVLSPNSLLGYLYTLAIFRYGGVYVSLNALSSREELYDNLAHAGCEILFVHEDLKDQCDILKDRGSVKVWRIINQIECQNSLQSACRDTAEIECIRPNPESDAWIIFSGGTTGKPKAIVHSHQSMAAVFLNMLAHLELGSAPKYLLAAPMTHAAGALLLPVLSMGGEVRFVKSPKPAGMLSEIALFQPQMLFLPPTAIYMLLAEPNVRNVDYSALRHFVYAASPMHASKLKESIEVFGPVMTQMYGQSEFPMMISYFSPDDHLNALREGRLEALSSAGKETILSSVTIEGENGVELPIGEVGEIVVSGPLQMREYLADPKATDETVKNGKVYTGDIGRMDENGFIYLLDRKRDMIISGGFNVFCPEVEDVLLSHKSVQVCAVIGVPDQKWGERVTGIVELKPGTDASPEALVSFCRERLGSIKSPKTIEIWAELPRSNVGKVLKKEIRSTFWENSDKQI